MNNNQISGTIPDALGQLTKLTHLFVSLLLPAPRSRAAPPRSPARALCAPRFVRALHARRSLTTLSPFVLGAAADDDDDGGAAVTVAEGPEDDDSTSSTCSDMSDEPDMSQFPDGVKRRARHEALCKLDSTYTDCGAASATASALGIAKSSTAPETLDVASSDKEE